MSRLHEVLKRAEEHRAPEIAPAPEPGQRSCSGGPGTLRYRTPRPADLAACGRGQHVFRLKRTIPRFLWISPSWRKIAAALLPLGLLWIAPAQVQPPSSVQPGRKDPLRAARRSHSTPKLAPVPAPVPPPPLTLEQMPASPPQVTYGNGLLTIVATNSTLSDILQAVAVHMGTSVDAPSNLTSERVAARLGPGLPRDVLSELLQGPRFNYILVGDGNDPQAIRTIIVSAKVSSPASPASTAPITRVLPARSLAAPLDEAEASEVTQQEQAVREQVPQFPPVPQGPQPSFRGGKHTTVQPQEYSTK